MFTPADRKRITEGYQAGQRLQAASRFGEAIEAYRDLLKRYPTVAEAHFQIARIQLAGNRLPEALAAVEAALKLRPKEESLWWLLADIIKEEGKRKPAAVLARARKAGLDEAALGRIERRFDAPSQRSTEAAPEAARPFLRRAAAAGGMGDDQAALKHINRALKKAPGSPPVLMHRVDTLMAMGDLDAAEADARQVVQGHPEVGHYWAVWARIKKLRADEPLLAELERRHAAAAPGTDDRRQMAYALAKAMEDIRADDRLFGYLNEANRMTAERYPFSAAADERMAEQARAAYSPALARRLEGKGFGELVPIFVTGLPRSGTTLVEQIISSHSTVTAGGELGIINKPMTDLMARLVEGDASAEADFAQVGEDYAAELRRKFPGRPIVTDKSIGTYYHVGHVPLALPKAKIVVVRRDPRDSCLAILKQRFKDGTHRYSYSMEGVAVIYKLFAAQVAFWRKAAPEAFIEVNYEDIIADQEGQTRRLLDYCGLPWEEACLNFHENERRVKTLSSTQVRQPLYSSSVGAWKRYEADLAPLLKALGPIEDLP